MATRDEITQRIRARFSDVRERTRILARALKARGEIAAARRRLRAAFAELGEEVYARLSQGIAGEWQEDELLQEFRLRVDGLKAEVRQRERALAVILANDGSSSSSPEEAGEEPGSDEDADKEA